MGNKPLTENELKSVTEALAILQQENEKEIADPSGVFEDIELCNETTQSGIKVYVRAKLNLGRLEISGQDIGGKNDYEYWYKLDEANTKKLFNIYKGNGKSIRDILLDNFGGLNGCRKLEALNDKNIIQYKFFSYGQLDTD